jgi:hypothetical protein
MSNIHSLNQPTQTATEVFKGNGHTLGGAKVSVRLHHSMFSPMPDALLSPNPRLSRNPTSEKGFSIVSANEMLFPSVSSSPSLILVCPEAGGAVTFKITAKTKAAYTANGVNISENDRFPAVVRQSYPPLLSPVAQKLEHTQKAEKTVDVVLKNYTAGMCLRPAH